MLAILIGFIALAVMLGLSWVITYVFVYVIFFCFGLTLTYKIATGIWFCLMLLSWTLSGSKKN